ncbi:hypothetical protein GJ496_010398 [Pomphorhynchus laevis]|nr:hypothetical protein GJ496_010398 [Pomphorhynchus laevis]
MDTELIINESTMIYGDYNNYQNNQMYTQTTSNPLISTPFYNPQAQYNPAQSFQQVNPPNLNPMVASMAANYGSATASHYKSVVINKLSESGYIHHLYRLFDVDTSYVVKKLLLLIFPFQIKTITGRSSLTESNDNEPLSPRLNPLNADLYIPVMSWITYILLCGISLGIDGKFSPELLGMLASKMLVFLMVEMIVIYSWIYFCDIDINLHKLDLLAFVGYKYWICILFGLGRLFLTGFANRCLYIYFCCALPYFLARTLKIAILSGSSSISNPYNSKSRLYLLVSIVLLQLAMIHFLTFMI